MAQLVVGDELPESAAFSKLLLRSIGSSEPLRIVTVYRPEPPKWRDQRTRGVPAGVCEQRHGSTDGGNLGGLLRRSDEVPDSEIGQDPER